MQFSQMAMGVADTLMSGHASTADLAAVAIGAGIWIPLYLLLAGFLTAITPMVAQLNGEKNLPQIGHTIRQSLWVAAGLGLISFIILQNTASFISFMGVEAQTIPIVLRYLDAVAWGFPGISAFLVLRYLNEGMSHTFPIMIVGLTGLLINIFLNYLLIFGNWGFPAMGGVGAGWATAITEWTMVVILFVYVCRSRFFHDIDLFKNDLVPDWQELKYFIALGFPIGISFFVEGSIFSVIALFIASLGNTIVAAHQIALSVSSVLFIIPLSISMGVTILVAHARGKKDHPDMIQTIKTGYFINLSLAFISATIIISNAAFIANLYTENIQVIQLASHLMIFAALYQFSDGVHLCSSGALRGLKDTAIPMLFSIFSFWLIGFPLGYLLGLTNIFNTTLGATGFWIGLLAGLTVSALLLSARLYLQVKKQHQQLLVNAQG